MEGKATAGSKKRKLKRKCEWVKCNLHKLIENTIRKVNIRKNTIKSETTHIKKTKTKMILKE